MIDPDNLSPEGKKAVIAYTQTYPRLLTEYEKQKLRELREPKQEGASDERE